MTYIVTCVIPEWMRPSDRFDVTSSAARVENNVKHVSARAKQKRLDHTTLFISLENAQFMAYVASK